MAAHSRPGYGRAVNRTISTDLRRDHPLYWFLVIGESGWVRRNAFAQRSALPIERCSSNRDHSQRRRTSVQPKPIPGKHGTMVLLSTQVQHRQRPMGLAHPAFERLRLLHDGTFGAVSQTGSILSERAWHHDPGRQARLICGRNW